MRADLKRDAIRAYKERKPQMGIYALRCAATGEVWVGQTTTLDKRQNRLWFALRLGSERPVALQQAWNAHGADAFSFEVVEQLGDDETAHPGARLDELQRHWLERLSAQPI